MLVGHLGVSRRLEMKKWSGMEIQKITLKSRDINKILSCNIVSVTNILYIYPCFHCMILINIW